MKILILDNYDSFTWNLAQYFEEIAECSAGAKILVYKNNEKTLAEIETEKPTHIVISPGPGTPKNPKDIGICLDVIKKFAGKIPILGVCLGHQAIAYFYGADIVNAPEIVHGKTSIIVTEIVPETGRKTGKKSQLFEGIPEKFTAMRYHSLIIDEKKFPKDLRITARTTSFISSMPSSSIPPLKSSQGSLIMALEHKKFRLYGIQFHPESFATLYGKKILENFIQC